MTSAQAFSSIPATPAFDLTAAAAKFPPLGGVAFPVVQDRWERLVTMATIPEPAHRVWAALIDPERVREWLAVCRGDWATRDRESTLDFEDGEFFHCMTTKVTPPTAARVGVLRHLWRWVGIGPAAQVTWTLTTAPDGASTTVTVLEEATNPPSDWRSWNGMGWPGILDQLAAHLRTGANTRWPWRRMGPYMQIPLPAMPFHAWDVLTSPGAIKHWMQRVTGSLAVDDEMTLVMGDASGTVRMCVTKSVDAGQEFPSYLPYLEFELRRPSWTAALGGRMWIEPAALGQSLLQIFHYGWEGLDLRDPLTERKLLTNFWLNAAARAQMLVQPQPAQVGPHGWSMSNGSSSNGHQPAAEMDFGAAMGFAQRVMGDLGGAMASVMAALGVRLGLFGALAAGPATSDELATRTGLAPRYVREWLWCMTSAAYVRHERDRFVLPPEHAAVLAAESSPLNMSAGFELVPPLASMLDAVADAFRTGQGIAQEKYPDQFFVAMERMSATWLDTMLVDQGLPAVDGLVGKLRRGAKVADVGSGGGRALIRMAQQFKASEFVGYDLSAANVSRATVAAEEAGVADRVHFQNVDAITELRGPLDLITMFDVLHDAPDPEALLSAAHRTGGEVLVLESSSADDPEDNAGAQGTILYATSTLYCVPAALAEGGPALGTLGLPNTEMRALARRAGFQAVQEIPLQNPMNALYRLVR
ncbi:MAG: methyltransferase domain-containing protein [Chloroflexi bacterium]|nr:methyltransferase domain-containing protein [Acidobacteriota bacterium]MCA1587962.1 methyltransferase domain-containing protein [Chloroflexota bacterium]MCA1719559.1 methyltransferase domain-containing protein [Actinomycetota bacterium]